MKKKVCLSGGQQLGVRGRREGPFVVVVVILWWHGEGRVDAIRARRQRASVSFLAKISHQLLGFGKEKGRWLCQLRVTKLWNNACRFETPDIMNTFTRAKYGCLQAVVEARISPVWRLDLQWVTCGSLFTRNGGRAHYIIESKVQWKPCWLATQQYPQNDWLGGKFPYTMTYAHGPHCHPA